MSSALSTSARQLKRHDREPVVEVVSERMSAHGLFQVYVGQRDYADIYADRLFAAEPLEAALFDDPQQLRLRREVEAGDLV